MKQLIIVVPDGENNLSSITGAYEIFNKANAFWKENKGRQLFNIQLAGIAESIDFSGGFLP